ncbi:collagenase [Mesobacillus subterraneus]|uniref:collagenase n=1 Tax=Mesobacillus subterraneus TaxID=285983 RepID=UPI002040E4DC|nr:collagenase [Mesobacillus subterraneus]
MTVFTILLIIFIVAMFGMLKMFQKELNDRTGENSTLYETLRTAMHLNYDSELETELKRQSMMKKDDHVTIYYQEENKDLIPLVIETLKRANTKTYQLLGDYDQSSIDLIFMNRENLEQLSNIDGAAGFYSDFLKVMGLTIDPEKVDSILQELETPLYYFQKTILHEYAHYATFRKIGDSGAMGDAFPLWFIEGVAEYIGNDKTEVHYESFHYETLSLKSISGEDKWKEARLNPDADPYLQSYFTVNYLMQDYGENVVTDLIDKTKETDDFYIALEQVTGKTILEFEQDVLKHYE